MVLLSVAVQRIIKYQRHSNMEVFSKEDYISWFKRKSLLITVLFIRDRGQNKPFNSRQQAKRLRFYHDRGNSICYSLCNNIVDSKRNLRRWPSRSLSGGTLKFLSR